MGPGNNAAGPKSEKSEKCNQQHTKMQRLMGSFLVISTQNKIMTTQTKYHYLFPCKIIIKTFKNEAHMVS